MKKQADRIRQVGLIGNSEKVSCGAAVRKAARLIAAAGREFCSDPVTAKLTGLPGIIYPDSCALSRAVDLLLVFGGDGTILRVARETAGSTTPILGVNLGSLGFLTAVPSPEMRKALRQVWAGEFNYESRVLLQVAGRSGGKPITRTALNDIVISRGAASRLIELEVRTDGELLTLYRCDGLIISSPTGSTAYSLAAGGPVVFPTAAVITLTPICPHTLSNRALILPLNTTIEVKVASTRDSTILSADGETVADLPPGEKVTIRRSRRTVRLMHLSGSSFSETLRRKLHWRGTTI